MISPLTTIPAEPQVTIDAESHAPGMTAQVIRFKMAGPTDNILREKPAYWLDMSLSPRPRNVRGCYNKHWNPHRFERMGKLFLVPPGETLHTRTDSGSSQTSIVCHLSPEAMRNWLDADFEWTDRGLEASLNIQNDNVRSLLLRLAHETRYPGFATETMTELIAGQLTIELGRYFRHLSDIPVSGGLAPWRLRIIDEYLREMPATPTLSELANLCKLSVRQLTRGFRTSRGCSIGDYLASNRINHAKTLLSSGQSVKEVAYALGFSSPSSFCFAFRRATGVTPREFLRRGARLQ
jgi:AraC family transcriptional regulator